MKTFIAVLVLASATAYADGTTKTTETPKAGEAAKPEKLTKAELQVLAHYHELNMMEVDLGKAAMKRATTPAVKAYGEMLVKDHGEADVKLKAIAKKTKQMIPAEKPATEAEKMEKAEGKKAAMAVKKLAGADFEREYLRMMVDGHDKELTKVDTFMAQVQNEAVLEMLRGKKPVLQKHADGARELQKSGAQASIGHSHP